MKRLNSYSAYLAFCGLCLSSPSLNANPEGGTVVNGSATFNQQGSTLTVTNTPGTIINWQKFSIQPEETTRFVQQTSDSAVLNRVVGQDPSQILGKLQSNGRVFIINPNGIVFGADSVIDVSGLAASTLNLSNEDFLSQNLNFTGDGANGNINNQGAITTTEGGFVYLIASDVENHGVITSPKGEVILAAGHSVQLVSSNDPDIRVTLTAPEGEALNVGEIITRGGKTSIYAGVINQQGKVSADSAVVGENGKIFFKATQHTTLTSTSVTTANGNEGGSVTITTTQGLTEVSGVVTATGDSGQGGEILILGEHVGILDEANIDASGQTGGGTILIGGDNKGSNPDIQNAKATYVGVNTQMHADAIEEGDGGKVIVWSDDATRAYGTITAKGGSVSGNGGFVETSGGYLDVAGLNLDVTAQNGSSGSWLLDPYDITITNTTTVNTTAGPVYTATATGSNIFNGDINTQLDAGTAVTIDTTGAGAEQGNITVSSAITKTTGAATTLTLKAHNNIQTDASISGSGGLLNIVLTADQDLDGIGNITLNGSIDTFGGSLTANAGASSGTINLNNTIISQGGNVSFTGGGDITLNSGTTAINAGLGNVTLDSINGSIVGDPAGGPKDIIATAVTLNANNNISANGGSAPFYVDASSITFDGSGIGNIRIYNNHAGASSVTGTKTGAGNVIIESFDTANPFTVNNISVNNGYLSLRTGTINIVGTVNVGTNDIYLKPYLADAVSVGGSVVYDLTSAELANITAGNIHVGKDTFGNYANSNTIAGTAAVNFGGKNVWLYSNNGIVFGANNVTNAGGQLYVENLTTGDINTGGGNISSDFLQFKTVGLINIGAGGITSTNAGNVYLVGADVNISGQINAGTNNVYLSPTLANTTISIGGAQSFNLSQADLNNISANTINFGENLASVVNAGNIDLATSEAINIVNNNVIIKGTGNVTQGAFNFGTSGGTSGLNIYTSGTGSISSGGGQLFGNGVLLNSANNLTINSGGILSTNPGITLTAANNISLNGNIDAAGAPVNITSTAGNLDNYSNILSSGSAFTVNVFGYISLNATGTDIGAGSISLTSTNSYINGSETASYDLNSGGTITLNTATGISSGPSTSFGVNTPSLSFSNTTSGDVLLRNYWAATNTVTGSNSSTGTTHLEFINPGPVTFNTITAGGSLSILSDIVNIPGTLTSGADFYIAPFSSIPISIDGSAVFDLTQGELQNINSSGIITIGSDGVTTKASSATISTLASTTIGGGPGAGVIRAIGDITLGANNFDATGTTMSLISDTGNINGGAGVFSATNMTLNAGGSIIDGNGNGVLDVNATNLTVIAGSNASLDYQITGTLNSAGVTGTADLRVFPAGSGTTTTTTSSTNEPLTTTIATIANTTNTLSSSTTSTSTSTTLSDSTATNSTTDTSTTGDTTTESSSTTTDGTTSEATASNAEDEPSKETESTSTSSDEKQPQTLAKKLPICK